MHSLRKTIKELWHEISPPTRVLLELPDFKVSEITKEDRLELRIEHLDSSNKPSTIITNYNGDILSVDGYSSIDEIRKTIAYVLDKINENKEVV